MNVFPAQELYQLVRDLQLPVPNVVEFVQNLNYQGYLLKRGPNAYKVVSAEL